MTNKTRFSLLPLFQALALLSIAPTCLAGQNFSIQPNGSLPTQVNPGSTVVANFTLTNLTSTARNGYAAVGLPNTVTQDGSGGNCSKPINLAGHASCNLKFNITGAVNSTFAICRGNSCTTETTPLNVSVVASSSNMVASGGYCSQSTCFPLLAQSITGSLTRLSTWTYPASIISNFPSNPVYVTPTLLSASCSGSICIAAGDDTSDGQFPLLAVTTNSGATWTYPIGSTGSWPSDAASGGDTGVFSGTSCSGSWCVAVGNYIASSVQYPLVAQSINGGVTWNYAIDSSNPPPTLFVTSTLNDASCSGSLCIAGGTYEDNSDTFFYPLLAQSTNSGTSWAFKLDKNNGPLPSAFSNTGLFNSSTCNDSICLAAGNYIATDTNQYAMIVKTADGGATYSYVFDRATGPLPANFSNSGVLNSVNCTNSVCVAAGFYLDTEDNIIPLAVRSTDNGTTWVIAIDDTVGPQPANYLINGIFNSVSCNNSICTVVGTYTDTGSNNDPILVQSIDNGATWAYQIDNTFLPPGYTSNGQFNRVTCNSQGCFAVGNYTQFQTQFPLLAQQTGTGSWTYVIDNNSATLPSDFAASGIFNGSASSLNLINKLHSKHIGKSKK